MSTRSENKYMVVWMLCGLFVFGFLTGDVELGTGM